MDDRLYPQGKGGIRTKYNSAGALVFFNASGTEIYRIDPTVTGAFVVPRVNFDVRTRIAVATVTAGTTLLAAVSGFKYRMISCKAIAIGGAAGAVTTVDVLGTQAAASVKLVAFAQASLTQSTVLKDGGAGAAVLTDGASYAPCDAGTAITVGVTGSAITTATSIDFLFSYALEA